MLSLPVMDSDHPPSPRTAPLRQHLLVNEPLFRVQNMNASGPKEFAQCGFATFIDTTFKKKAKKNIINIFFSLNEHTCVAPERTLVSFDGFVDQHVALQFVFTIKGRLALLARKRLLSCNKDETVPPLFYGHFIGWSPLLNNHSIGRLHFLNEHSIGRSLLLYGQALGRSPIYYGQKSFSIDVFCSCYCLKNHISFTVRCVNRLTVNITVDCKQPFSYVLSKVVWKFPKLEDTIVECHWLLCEIENVKPIFSTATRFIT